MKCPTAETTWRIVLRSLLKKQTKNKLKELETMIRILQSELNSAKRETVKVNITNQDIKSSLGSTIKTVGDLVRKNGFKK